MKITKRQLREMIKEEKLRLVNEIGSGDFSYKTKLVSINQAVAALKRAQEHEKLAGQPDPELDELVEDLKKYADAVRTMVNF